MPDLPQDAVYRVYVSALTQLNLDRHNRVSTADSRLVRRIVRDAASRGYSAAETIRRWPSVQRGEKQHIFPYQEHSDAIFNSSLVHELAVLRSAAEPLLLQVRSDDPRVRGGQPAALVPAVVPPRAGRPGARQLDPAGVHRQLDPGELPVVDAVAGMLRSRRP